MEDYPRNLTEFEARVTSDPACQEYLCQLRWRRGFRCPRCGHDKSWAVRTALLECTRDAGIKVRRPPGTIFRRHPQAAAELVSSNVGG